MIRAAVLLAVLTAAHACGDTALCEILRRPADFNGKIVRVRGVVRLGMESSVLTSPDCKGDIWFAWSDPRITPVKDSQYREFERLMPRNTAIRATVTGRFDWSAKGFGHMGLHQGQIAVQRLADVAAISSKPSADPKP